MEIFIGRKLRFWPLRYKNFRIFLMQSRLWVISVLVHHCFRRVLFFCCYLCTYFSINRRQLEASVILVFGLLSPKGALFLLFWSSVPIIQSGLRINVWKSRLPVAGDRPRLKDIHIYIFAILQIAGYLRKHVLPDLICLF